MEVPLTQRRRAEEGGPAGGPEREETERVIDGRLAPSVKGVTPRPEVTTTGGQGIHEEGRVGEPEPLTDMQTVPGGR